MKRLILSAVALSMLAIPTVEAQAAPRHPQGFEQSQRHLNDRPDHVVRKKVVKKVIVKKRWSRGGRVSGWRHRHVVRDYGRYGLHRPGRGQQWIRVDNDYLLISIASGVIAGLIAAH